jgi:cell division protein ZapA
MSQNTTRVVEILGNDYTLRAPAEQEEALFEAAMMLKASLAETKKKHPTLVGDRLLVLTAMNLCSQILDARKEHREALAQYEHKVNATVEQLERTVSRAGE